METTDPKSLSVDVYGTPKPQGSKVVQRGHVRDARDDSRAWRDAMVSEMRVASRQVSGARMSGPVRLEAAFQFHRPATGSAVRHGWPYTSRTPDLDKLLRAVCDALQISGIINNDCQIVATAASKGFIGAGEKEGVCLTVTSML